MGLGDTKLGKCMAWEWVREKGEAGVRVQVKNGLGEVAGIT